MGKRLIFQTPLLLSTFLTSIPTLSPTFIAISSYSFIVILKVGEFPGIPQPAPYILDITLGRFFIKSSGEVNGIASPLLPADLGSFRSVKATNTY